MTTNKPLHTFHSPIRVAQYGISSVVSIIDDELMEKLTAFYSEKFNLPYQAISQKAEDYRARRITSYLNLVDKIVKEKFENFKTELAESKSTLENFIAMLPNKSEIKKGLQTLKEDGLAFSENIKNY